MKLVTYKLADGSQQQRVGVVVQDRVVDVTAIVGALDVSCASHALAKGTMCHLLWAGNSGLESVRQFVHEARHEQSHPLAALQLLAPIPRPGKVVAIGRNYAEHANEAGTDVPRAPRIISKLPSCIVGPGATTCAPSGVHKLDYEVELAVIMGRLAKSVTRDEALDYVAGYTIINDLSAREFQFDIAPAATTFAKSMDGFGPLGPWIVTADEIPNPQDLKLRLWVNHDLRQHATTSEMVFGVHELIAYVSQFMTLEPGDVLATGTPSGVGVGRKPPVWLQPGDTLRLEIERIGILEHYIGEAGI